jgi:very-short-patch-repair endonuclease
VTRHAGERTSQRQTITAYITQPGTPPSFIHNGCVVHSRIAVRLPYRARTSHGRRVNPVLGALLESGGGLVTRATALQVVPTWTLRRACRDGDVRRVLPEVYVDARLVDDRPGRESPLAALDPVLARRAVLAYADGRGALSGVTALAVFGLRRQPYGEPLHLDVPAGAGIRSRIDLVVHHRLGFVMASPHIVVRQGAAVTRLERTLVDAWPLLPPEDRFAPLIRAVNDRLTTPERVRAALSASPKLTGRAELRVLVDRLAAGCRSPLEIWGHDHVFTGPGMPVFSRQRRMRLGRRTMYLDLYAEAERVNIELDGTTTHGDAHQREIDLRRDALLATAGILVVRFSHRRLVQEPDEVRRETLAILGRRKPAGVAAASRLDPR